jgi:hypothetical protein
LQYFFGIDYSKLLKREIFKNDLKELKLLFEKVKLLKIYEAIELEEL